MKYPPKEPSLFILLLLTSFASISAVLFTPALPQIAEIMQLTPPQAQLSMSIFLVGYALGSLPYGPISNRFGRKPAVTLGVIIAIIGCAILLFVEWFPYFWLLILGRLVVAVGTSVGIKIAFTIVGDVYQHEKATKKIAYMLLAGAGGPGLAVALGGFLTHRFGWQSTFYFLMIYCVFIFLLSLSLPETCPEIDRDALKIKKIIHNYHQKFKNKILITGSLMMGCGTACIYLFASEAPFISITKLGLTPENYGLLNLIPPIGLMLGAILSARFAGKKHPMTIILAGSIFSLCVSIIMTLLFFAESINVWDLFIPVPFIYLGNSLVFSNASSAGMTHARNKSNASAVMNFINIGTSAVGVLIWESLPSHPSHLLPIFFVAYAAIILLLRGVLKKELVINR